MIISDKKHTPTEYDFLKPDGWHIGEEITTDNGFKDSSFPGCQFRIKSGQWPEYNLAINVTVTGKPHSHTGRGAKSRCKIEFVGDGEDSTFTTGWIIHQLKN